MTFSGHWGEVAAMYILYARPIHVRRTLVLLPKLLNLKATRNASCNYAAKGLKMKLTGNYGNRWSQHIFIKRCITFIIEIDCKRSKAQ